MMVANSGNSPEAKNGENLPRSMKATEPFIFVIIVIWVVAFCTVTYHGYEGERSQMKHKHRYGLQLSEVHNTIDRKDNDKLHSETGESNPSAEHIVQFEQIRQYEQTKEKASSKRFLKLKEQLSKLESNKRKFASIRESGHEHEGVGKDNFTIMEEMLDLETPDYNEDVETFENYNLGEVRSISSNQLCLDASEVEGSIVILYDCHAQGGNQNWEINENGEVRRGQFCLDYFGGPLLVFLCHGAGGNQKWTYEGQLLYHENSDFCLTVNEGTVGLDMKLCNDSPEQRWLWKGYKSSHLLSNNEL